MCGTEAASLTPWDSNPPCRRLRLYRPDATPVADAIARRVKELNPRVSPRPGIRHRLPTTRRYPPCVVLSMLSGSLGISVCIVHTYIYFYHLHPRRAVQHSLQRRYSDHNRAKCSHCALQALDGQDSHTLRFYTHGQYPVQSVFLQQERYIPHDVPCLSGREILRVHTRSRPSRRSTPAPIFSVRYLDLVVKPFFDRQLHAEGPVFETAPVWTMRLAAALRDPSLTFHRTARMREDAPPNIP